MMKDKLIYKRKKSNYLAKKTNKKRSIVRIILILMFLLVCTIGNPISAIPSNDQSIDNQMGLAEDIILVKFKTQVTKIDRLNIAKLYDLTYDSEISKIDILVYKVPEYNKQKVLTSLQNNINIEFAESDQIFQPELFSNDPLRDGSKYPYSTMSLPQAWDISIGGNTVRVSNPDTGVDVSHPDLAPNLILDLAYNAVDGSSDIDPVCPHGTETSGCIGAKTNNEIGIPSSCWSTEIIPIRVSNSPDGSASLTSICNAIIYAADHGAKVVSVSYGVGYISAVNSAGQYLREKTNGLLFVSAGNQNSYISSVNYPYIIVVGATDKHDKKASFSNYGSIIDLVAPGVLVYTTSGIDGYDSKSGTSISSPLAASVATYLYSVKPDATALEVEQALINGAIDLGIKGRDDYYGYGRVDALGALNILISGQYDTTPPTVSINSPTQDSTVSGTITINATATDDMGVIKVEFYIGSTLINTDTSYPYSCIWDTNMVSNGQYTLQAKAYDAANNIGSSDFVQITVNNQILLTFPSKPPSVKTYKNNTTISWETNIESTGLILYGYSKDNLYLQQNNLTQSKKHIMTLVGLSPSTRYYFKIVATNIQNPDEIIMSKIFSFKTKRK